MGATILNGATIGRNCLIGAGALVTENTIIPDNSLVVGTPAKIKRVLSEEQIEGLRQNARHYKANAIRLGQPKFALCEISFEFENQWVAIAPKALGQRCKSLGEMQNYGRPYKVL